MRDWKSRSDLLVETVSLTKRYGRFTALDGCTLQVAPGEVFGLLGPNGSGKTTLLRLLMGYLRPSAGQATVDGLDCHGQSVLVHGRVSYLPGEPRFSRRMRGVDVLRFLSAIRSDSDIDRCLQMAARLGLDVRRRVSLMSTGMRQKLALSATLAAGAPLLILDEPTTSLDPTVRGEVIQIVRKLREEGRAVLFSSHVLDEVEQVCDRVAILRRGQLVHVQALSELRVRHRIRARALGPLPNPPASLADELVLRVGHDSKLTMEAGGDLSPVLGWLATLPLAEVAIEPVGLRAIYDRFHAEPSA